MMPALSTPALLSPDRRAIYIESDADKTRLPEGAMEEGDRRASCDTEGTRPVVL